MLSVAAEYRCQVFKDGSFHFIGNLKLLVVFACASCNINLYRTHKGYYCNKLSEQGVVVWRISSQSGPAGRMRPSS
jgi:hypothetical protein